MISYVSQGYVIVRAGEVDIWVTKEIRDRTRLQGRARLRSNEDRVGLDYLASRPSSQDRVNGRSYHHWIGHDGKAEGWILQHAQKKEDCSIDELESKADSRWVHGYIQRGRCEWGHREYAYSIVKGVYQCDEKMGYDGKS